MPHPNPQDKLEAAKWAHELLKTDFIILDTETTDLHNPEVVQLAIIDSNRQVLLDCMLRPVRRPTWEDAERIHGISPAMVARCPIFDDVVPFMASVLYDRHLVIYNAGYDWDKILRPQCGDKLKPTAVSCAMLQYAQFYGDWNDYRGNYKWQKLPDGGYKAHNALGDCLSTLDVIHKMAQAYVPSEPALEGFIFND